MVPISGTSKTAMMRAANWSASTQGRFMVGRDGFRRAESVTQTTTPTKLTTEGDNGRTQIAEAMKSKDWSNGNVTSSAKGWTVSIATVAEKELNSSVETSRRMVTVTHEATGASQTFEANEDSFISFDSEGKLTKQTGAAIMQGGKLFTGDDSGVLIRTTSSDVVGGKGESVVLNLSNNDGSFEGGEGGLAFLGNYKGAVIKGGQGNNIFDGIFNDVTIFGGNRQNDYNGLFFGSTLEGGESRDHFNGIFADKSVVKGNAGDDTFYGQFVRSELSGGEGKNYFGVSRQQAAPTLDAALAKHSNQFVSSVIDAGESSIMDGIFNSSAIALGSGEHEITGMFDNTKVSNSDGTATIKAYYAEHSSFTGDTGTTDLTIRTGISNNVSLGDGENKVTLGKPSSGRAPEYFMGMAFDFGNVVTNEYADGSLIENSVDVSRGVTSVSINTGDQVIERRFTVCGTEEEKEDPHRMSERTSDNFSERLIESTLGGDRKADKTANGSKSEEDQKSEEHSSTFIENEGGYLSGAKSEAVTINLGENMIGSTYYQEEKRREYVSRSYDTFSSTYPEKNTGRII